MIAADLLNQVAMLATPTSNADAVLPTLLGGRYTFDIKWDGVRCLAYITDGTVLLRNRNAVDITHRYPDLVAQLAATYPTGTRVFDGEIVCFNPVSGKPEFGLAAKRDAQASTAKIEALASLIPATFMAFDFLWYDGDDLRNTPLVARQQLLATEAARHFGNNPQLMVSQWSDDGATLWQFVCDFGMEGLIAKDKAGVYRGRRDSGWLKLKKLHRLTAIVTGFENGKGARNGKVGALLLSCVDEDGRLHPIGKVGTGLKERDHAPMLDCLQRGEEFLVEVEYMGWAGEAIRFPSFKGLRSDVTRTDCTLDQIVGRS